MKGKMSRPMTAKDILNLIEHYGAFHGEIPGDCFDCGKPVKILVTVNPDDGAYTIEGGAAWIRDFETDKYFVDSQGKRKPQVCHEITVKCDSCYEKDKTLKDQPCEVYSRCVGYIRPVEQWNPGKKEEFKDRALYKIEKSLKVHNAIDFDPEPEEAA